jgi:hypothetical protein
MNGPTIEQMLGWLDRDPARLERHLTRHPHDADRLDQATALTEPQLQALSEATEVPAPTLDRLRVRLVTDPAATDALKLMAELMGVAWDTARLMGTATPEKDRNRASGDPAHPSQPSGDER